ncbi:MAG: alpha/beta hydrolase family protein [Candidatus Cyclobacteriaceae bacterium M2_1C_046]
MITSPILINEKIGTVSATLSLPEKTEAIFLFTHGAGAGMEHPFMNRISEGLNDHKIGTMRFNFPYMDKGRKAPGSQKEAVESIKRVYEQLKNTYEAPLFIGGKSYGGRMASHAAAEGLIPNINGLIFLGFPLHAPGKNSTERADHLGKVKHSMLFLQGAKDKLADIDLIRKVTGRLPNATLTEYADADHSFKVPKRSSYSQEEIYSHMIREAALWMKRV